MNHLKCVTNWSQAETYEELKDVFHYDKNCIRFDDDKNCFRCYRKLFIETCNVQTPSRDGEDILCLPIYFKTCSTCNLCQFIWCCMQWFDINLILDLASSQHEEILKKAYDPKDHIIIYLLGQVCHNQQDIDLALFESPIGYGNFHNVINILFQDGSAKGFYILKEKGEGDHFNQGLNSFLPMVDFLYIRKKYRSNGLGTMMLKSIIDTNDGKDVYFSVPLSSSICSILSLLLRNNPSLRNNLWGVDGEICERFSIYYHLIFQNSQKIK